MTDPRIPIKYRALWRECGPKEICYHLTTKENLESIKRMGHLEPRDPAPRNWAGMKAIFMADPSDPLYTETLPHVLAHVKKKHSNLVRLHIVTSNQLYQSLDPERTFQIMSLAPISYSNIVKVEEV